jgi:crotonobetainyl-CoA:carnitine CoA-transferase CaiB-like acyl-CoA transferase
MSKPFTGVKILDFTRVLAGPYGTYQLALLGADVIKVESREGDDMRYGNRANDWEKRGLAAPWVSVNAGKRSITLDLKQPKAIEVIKRLVPKVDVVTENFRPGVMDKLGIGYETLKAINPRLIYCAVSGFGQVGPERATAAFDGMIQAMSGLMSITGFPSNGPTRVGFAGADVMSGATSALGIASALYQRTHTGKGQLVDVAMVDAILSMCERIVHQHAYTGDVPVPEGNHHPLLCPFGMFPAKDGHVTLAAPTDAHWPILCRLIGKPEMGRDPRFETVQGRRANQAEIIAAVSDYTRRHTKHELLKHLGGQVPFAPVNDVRDVFADPHFAARDMLASVPHPGLDRDMKIAGVAIKMTETPGRVRHRAPLLGEHTDEYLKSIGCSAGDIARLRADRVVA